MEDESSENRQKDAYLLRKELIFHHDINAMPLDSMRNEIVVQYKQEKHLILFYKSLRERDLRAALKIFQK